MITLVLRPVALGHRGQLYDIEHDGETIVTGSRDPEHDGARALQARGLSGSFQTTDDTGKVRMMFPSIAEAAGWSVTEDDRGLRRQRWRPHPLRRSTDALKYDEGTEVAHEASEPSLKGAALRSVARVDLTLDRVGSLLDPPRSPVHRLPPQPEVVPAWERLDKPEAAGVPQ